MEENLKGRIILILAILCVILLIGNISSCSNALRHKAARDKEMFSRLDMEEKMSKYSSEKAALEKQLESEKAVAEEAKKTLMKAQLEYQSLEEELEKVTKLKEALEEDLKEALIKKQTR